MTAYEFASEEMQALFIRLEARAVEPELIEAIYQQHTHEIARRADKAQVEVFDIVSRIENKIDDDVNTRLGVTNGMIADINMATQALAGGLKESAQDRAAIHDWMARIEARPSFVPQEYAAQIVLLSRRLRWATLALAGMLAAVAALALVLFLHLGAGG